MWPLPPITITFIFCFFALNIDGLYPYGQKYVNEAGSRGHEGTFLVGVFAKMHIFTRRVPSDIPIRRPYYASDRETPWQAKKMPSQPFHQPRDHWTRSFILTTQTMKTFAWILVFLALGCHKSSDMTPTIDSGQLIGTWKNLSSSGLLPFQWTFNSDFLYLSNVTTTECQPIQTQPWEYRIEKNVLVAKYVGTGGGSNPLPETRFSIIFLTGQRMILQAASYQQEEFDRCQ
jgi:hypothetical protein